MENNKVFSNFFWRFFERCGAQGVNLIVSIVLARLLSPEDYGLIALVTVFTTIMSVFVDSGLGTALIQKKDADNLDFSSVFYFNLFMCFILYIIMFVVAPYIALYYKNPTLTSVIRVISLTIIISGIKNIQLAYVSREMIFRKFFFSTIGGTIFSAILGIYLAYNGYGVWALVFQQLSNTTIDTAILWMTVKWKPKRMFSIKRLRGLLSYGWKLLVSTLLDTGYNNLRNLIIGKLFSSADLAYYTQGMNIPNLIVSNINDSINSVLLPTMSREQDDRIRVKKMTRRSITISIYVMAPMMMGLSAMATPLVKLLLTDKWLPCIPFLRIFCISYMFWPIHTANLNAINAMGRSDLFLRLEVIKKIVGLLLLGLTMRYGIMAMAYSLLVESITDQIINSWPNRKLLNYGYLEQLKDVIPSILLAIFMGICVYLIAMLKLHSIIVIVLQLIVGIVIYVGGSLIFKFDSFSYLLSICKGFLHKKVNENGVSE